ncbi:NAD-dependent epimerase/dehydratase family protein [Shewanella sp.]|uniref:NAD-dependent epimerase/dehydratase family protein n=1 Tax=Shewanella sp. TaxID=50422 RepID=UPI00404860D6
MACIVGGSGFIGTCLSQRLTKATKSFSIIDKAPSRAFPGHVQLADVRILDALRQSIPENAPLINLAAEHRDDVRPLSLYDEVNVGGARNLCTIAREKNVRTIVFTSTVAVYGFAPIGTDESGKIAPFNDYGRTKYEAEQVFKAWQAEAPEVRTLVIIRPTVVFGEQNRGNVYNLLRQIASGRFVMVGKGENRKSMAYVENIAAFIEYSLSFKPGVHIYNFIDKPDFTMNQLVGSVKRILGQPEQIGFRLPYEVGYAIGKGFDLVAAITGKRLAISSIRVKKFCANSVYNTAIDKTGFVPPVPLAQALEQTIRHEFIEKHDDEPLYFSE